MFKIKFFDKYDISILSSLFILNFLTITYFPYYIYHNGIVWQEILLFFVGWLFAGLGITVGYHRYFAHKSFSTYPIIEWIFMFCGTMGLQNKIINWCSDHRKHHRLLDTSDDPYSIKEGFFHAHIGWIFKKTNNETKGISDLSKKSAVKFQAKFYWVLAIFLCFFVPFLIGLTFGRPIGGLLWGGIFRVVAVHHFTFFINSLCHYTGDRKYDCNTSARDSWYMAFLTFGEGYHNYHHKFQWDYRNGISWYSFDPSKWLIKLLSFFKITYKLKEVSGSEIFRARIETLNERIYKISKKTKFNHILNKRILKITNKAFKNIDSWKNLEKQYNKLSNKYDNMIYRKRIKSFELELKKSLSSLMLILVNLKNIA
tara:strand:+ start:967 stop:2076 length:1110 start_codon:yes stop_codon:yes gene_type:complete